MKRPEAQFETKNAPNWCPGCGDFAVWQAFKEAAVEAKWHSHNTAIVAGIGCHGHMVNFLKIVAFEGLHGRALPVATGIKLANHDMNVFAFVGDGDCLAEGGNHFLHTARRNHNITVLLHDNAIYGLTTGQTSPRTNKEQKTKSTPSGSIEEPIHPLRLAIAAGATFAARVYVGDIEKTKEIIIKANNHKGFAVVQMLQPCVTFNKVSSHEFYQQNTYWLPKEYDASDKLAALAKTMEWGEGSIPVGVLYQSDEPSYESLVPQLDGRPLVKQPLRKRNIKKTLEQFG